MRENISSEKEKKQGGNETSTTKITAKSSLCNPATFHIKMRLPRTLTRLWCDHFKKSNMFCKPSFMKLCLIKHGLLGVNGV